MHRAHVLITGLGNPGNEYAHTRHNLGFMIVSAFAEKWQWPFKKKRLMKGNIASGKAGIWDVILLLPMTYMNLSGSAVSKVVSYYKVDLAHLLIVCDDIALPFGKMRYRVKGSCGGHKGLKDIEGALGTQEYERLRIGIGSPDRETMQDYVLSSFNEKERSFLPQLKEESIVFLENWLEKQQRNHVNKGAL